MFERLTCRLVGHRPVLEQTRHPVGRDIIAVRSQCGRCRKVLRSWPPPLGVSTGTTVFATRPPLMPIADLDPGAWSILCWRQEHLPLGHVRNGADRDSLVIIEGRAANRAAERFGLDNLHTHSLVVRHRQEVERRLREAGPAPATAGRDGSHHTGRRQPHLPHVLNFTVGWGTWFQNRQVGLRWRWFRLRTRSAFRGIGAP
jgi:hypothetical protein